MVRPYAALVALLIPDLLCAQVELPSFAPHDTVTMPCPQDTSILIRGYQGWEAYQTTDDAWYGPRDTTRCFDLWRLLGTYPYPSILVDQIAPERPVFLRARYNDDYILPLSSNNQYGFGFSAYGPYGFDTGSCPGGPCTGAFAAVRIPSEDGLGTDLRWYDAAYDDQEFGPYPFTLCVPTEKFELNELREYIVSMKLAESQPGQYIESFWSEVQDMEQWGTLVRLTEDELPAYRTGPASYEFWSFSWLNFLVMHPGDSYPSATNIGYLDFSPEPNLPDPTPITVTLGDFTGFNFQPHTQLRGSLVEGSDTLRHPLTVINQGADVCMGWEFIEVLWPDASTFEYRSGHVDMASRQACFQFQSGSTLRIASGSTFQYGWNGRGMLLMSSEAKLDIATGGTLDMHGMLIMKEPPGATEAQDFHVTLVPGTRLRFAPGARLHNDFSIGSRMQLVVTLDGGDLDISGLSPEDRAKVRVVELPAEGAPLARVLGNPVQDELVMELALRAGAEVQVRVVDAMGRLVWDQGQAHAAGITRSVLDVRAFRPGHYVLEARSGDARTVVRFIKP
ncbi:MAG: T9SS type A sorting domain-containing protein [Flavobacteriales bacterium]